MAIYEFIVNWWCQTLNKFCAANPKEKLHSEHGISSSSIFNMKKTRVIAHKQQTNERASERATDFQDAHKEQNKTRLKKLCKTEGHGRWRSEGGKEES